jgi:hypothetical protein
MFIVRKIEHIYKLCGKIAELFNVKACGTYSNQKSRDSDCYGLDDRGAGVRVPVGIRIFPSPRLADRFWSQPVLLFQ